ncbi:MAG: CRISPR-associated protein Cas4, partial [Streptosporangiaceae bacterium]
MSECKSLDWRPPGRRLALLLRAHGYTADRGEVFYAETRQRVPVEITLDLVARTMEIVGQARTAAARLAPSPPPRSSPKCGRCSLAGICLPDEVKVLTSSPASWRGGCRFPRAACPCEPSSGVRPAPAPARPRG